MSAQNPKSQVPESTVSAVTNITKRTYQLVQNYLLIWVDGDTNLKNEDRENILTQLRDVVRKVDHCTTAAECIEFLKKMNDQKVFIISSGYLGQHLVSDIHDLAQVHTTYIFCDNKELHEGWMNEWPKVEGVFTAIEPICESLKKVTRECNRDTISMSFVPKRKTETISDQDSLDDLPPSFMYWTLFKEIILETEEDDNKSISNLVAYCLKKNIFRGRVK